MSITDLDGKKIEVTDLEKAILQAGSFKEMRHEDPVHVKLDEKLQRYWADVYNKLLKLKNK